MEPQRLPPSEVHPSELSAEAQSWLVRTTTAIDPAKVFCPQGTPSRSAYPLHCGGRHPREALIDSLSNRRALQRAIRLYDQTLPARRGGVSGDRRAVAHPL